MNTPNESKRPSVAQVIATELAKLDGYDPEDLHGGLYELRWSGGPNPEPEGDAWNMDYMPKGERIARVLSELDRSEPEQRETLDAAQPAQAGEAVAAKPALWAIVDSTTGDIYWNEDGCFFSDASSANNLITDLEDESGTEGQWITAPLYFHPQPEQPEQRAALCAAAAPSPTKGEK